MRNSTEIFLRVWKNKRQLGNRYGGDESSAKGDIMVEPKDFQERKEGTHKYYVWMMQIRLHKNLLLLLLFVYNCDN